MSPMTVQLTELSLRPDIVSSQVRVLMRSLASLCRWKVHPLSTIIRLRGPCLPLDVAVDHLAGWRAARHLAGVVARGRDLAVADSEALSSLPGSGRFTGTRTR